MGMLERRPAGRITVDSQGRIVLDPGAQDRQPSTRRKTAPVSAQDVERARQQLRVIGDIKKTARRGSLLHKLVSQDERRHRQTVKVGAYRDALVEVANSRQRRAADAHLDIAVELLRGLGDHYRGSISLSADDRRDILAGVQWHRERGC